MTDDVLISVLAAIRGKAAEQEKAVARGHYEKIGDLRFQQGILEGLEQALQVSHNLIAEREDKLNN